MNLQEVFFAAMDAGNQPAAALAILAHPGSVHMQREGLDRLVSIWRHGEIVEPKHLDVMWALADCWEALGAEPN